MAVNEAERPPMRGTTIARRSLHDEVIERLRDMIVEGELPPGSRVPERTLCERFGISRTPLREALKVLASEGLVELLPNRGARIVALSAADVDELFEVLAGLEALAGELACARISRRELQVVRRAHDAMVRCFETGDLSTYFKLNQEIHQRILAAAGNETLRHVHESLAGRIKRARFMANLSSERWRQAVEEHEQIIAGLEARDGERVSRVLQQHLINKAEVIKRALSMTIEAEEGVPG